MSRRLIIASALAAALLFGVVVSGCNRNRDVAMEARRTRQENRQRARTQKKPRRSRNDTTELASLRTSGPRPAEVLSTTVRRQPGRSRKQPERQARRRQDEPRRQQGVRPISASEFARSEPVPMPPVYATGYTPAPAPSTPAAYASIPSQHAYNGGEYGYPASMTVYDPPVPVVVLSPQLAMAQASLQPAFTSYPAPAAPLPTANNHDLVAPAVNAGHFAAPIPELEPVRYQRVATPAPAANPAPGAVMMSSRVGQTFESFRTPQLDASAAERAALAPLAQPSRAASEWVPSPFTAMRSVF